MRALSLELKMAEIDRRGFLALSAGLCAACALGGTAFAAAAKTNPVDIGPLADFKADGISDKFVRQGGFLIIRTGGRLFAASNLCTHKGVPLNVKGAELVCPKHNSHFSIEGTVTKGPAKSTLVRYGISLDDKGHVIVDPSKEFHEKNFDDKASFIAIEK